MSHHEHNPMKGHPRGEMPGRLRRWHRFALRNRSDAGDHVVQATGAKYPGVFSYVSGHRDAPVTPLQRLLWWLIGFVVVFGGIVLIIFWMR